MIFMIHLHNFSQADQRFPLICNCPEKVHSGRNSEMLLNHLLKQCNPDKCNGKRSRQVQWEKNQDKRNGKRSRQVQWERCKIKSEPEKEVSALECI